MKQLKLAMEAARKARDEDEWDDYESGQTDVHVSVSVGDRKDYCS
jgi:hypothetical protein